MTLGADNREAVLELYIDLVKRVLTRYGFEDGYASLDVDSKKSLLRQLLLRPLQRQLSARGLEIVKRTSFHEVARRQGRDRPATAETMVGLDRLDNLERCITDVLIQGVPGDLMEVGAWRGGATILMRAVLAAHGVSDRVVWVADSFCGLPKPDAAQFPADVGDTHWTRTGLAVSLPEVRQNFDKYGLLDDQVRFLPGWFRDTLPDAPVHQIAVLRLDGDLYESTLVALQALYPKVSAGGYLIVDDYGALETCRAAVDDYRADQGIDEGMVKIDWTGVFWQKRG
jgi:O-methyltransferase